MKKFIFSTRLQRLVLTSLLIFSVSVSEVSAGEGHDHGNAPATANTNGPQRNPDGSVFLPKQAQRQLMVRTIVVEEQTLPLSFELNARVVMDPNAGGKVQPLNAGRIEPGPQGLPNAGQSVSKGDLLAYVVTAVAPLEKASQSAQLAELRAAQTLAEKRVKRLRKLADTIPRKDLDAAESELLSLTDRISVVDAGLSSREALMAPVTGVIATAQAVSGQVVDARELLFEIIDPQRLRIEALTFDPTLANNVGGAFLLVGEQRVPLTYLGAARSLREQALPLNFLASNSQMLGLALGQPVKVYIQTKQQTRGIPVPMASLMKNSSNQTVVWVKTGAEQFTPRTVTFEPLNGTQVAVTSGIKVGDRVATHGATLINQIR